MGQGGSTEFKEAFQSTIGQLSEVQLAEIGSRYNELYKQAGGNQGRIIDREKFSEYFNLPVALGDRLFEAFDRKQNGSVDFEEFVCGLAILTHGSFSDKCKLLFSIFNLAGDEGVSREELYSLLFSVVTSTSTILLTLTEGAKGRSGSPISEPDVAVKNLVNTAFRNCDISKSGKLLPLEFEYWLKRNPKILDYLLPSIEDPEESDTPTLVPLLFVPEDKESIQKDIPEDLTSVQLEGEDGLIETEGGASDPQEVGTEINEGVEDKGDVTGIEGLGGKEGMDEEEGKEEEEEKDPGTTEPPPSPTDFQEEDDKKDEKESPPVEDETNKDKPSSEDIDSKPRSTSNLSATEETIQLARALSECLTSPVVEDMPSLVLSDDGGNKKVSDRILSAWLPSPLVEGMLASGRKGPPEFLTQPGLISQTGKSDPLAEVLSSTFPGAARRQQPSVDQVKLNEEGLHILLQNGCYHGALELTSQFLSAHGQGLGQAGQMAMHTHKTLQMWNVRLSLLYSLSRYDEAEKELRAFKELDQPDLYYQYDKRQYPEAIGSMVPFPLRLLHAQLPLHLNNSLLALNRTCVLQNTTQRILGLIKQGKLPLNDEGLTPDEQGVAQEVWLSRLVHVKFALCRCLLEVGDYFLVKTVLEEILKLVPKCKVEVLSALGRLSLLYGDIASAESYFATVTASTEQDSALNSTNRSFLDLYRNQWEKAEEGFLAGYDTDSSSTLNNVTVCAVHQEKLSRAITQMEDNIKGTPANNLNSSIFFSLFTYYDLESSQAQAKKLSWLPFLGQHAPEGFNVTALGLLASS